MVFFGGSCFDIFWHLVTCFDSWTFFLSLSFVPRLSFCTGRSWPKGGLGSNVKKTSRQEDSISIPHKFRIRDVPQMPHIFCIFLGVPYINTYQVLYLSNSFGKRNGAAEVGTPRARSQSRGPRLEAPRFEAPQNLEHNKNHENSWNNLDFFPFLDVSCLKNGISGQILNVLSPHCRFWFQVMILGRNSRSQAAPVRVGEPWKGQWLVAAAAVSVEKGRVDTSIH